MNSKDEQAGLVAVLAALRRRIWIIGVATAVVAISAYVFSAQQEDRYSASATLLFVSGGPYQDPTQQAATNLGLASLNPVARRAASRLGLSPDEPRPSVSISEQGDSKLFSVTASGPSPVFAARFANAYANTFAAFSHTALTGAQANRARVVQRATVPTSPTSPQTRRNTIFGAFLGLLIGVGLALGLENLDRRLREPTELEQAFGMPLVGQIPDSKLLETPDAGSMSVADREAFRMLRTQLRYFNVDRDLRSVLVTSPSPQDGKSTVTWYLAATAASAGSPTVLLEADLHRPTLAAQHGLKPLPGLAEVLSHQATVADATTAVQLADVTDGANAGRSLDVIVAGTTPPNPVELIESQAMGQLLSELTERYELVILDTPPVSLVADTIPLMKLVSGVIVVGQLGKTTRAESARLSQQLGNVGAPVLGVVANRTKSARGYGGDDEYYEGKARPWHRLRIPFRG